MKFATAGQMAWNIGVTNRARGNLKTLFLSYLIPIFCICQFDVENGKYLKKKVLKLHFRKVVMTWNLLISVELRWKSQKMLFMDGGYKFIVNCGLHK